MMIVMATAMRMTKKQLISISKTTKSVYSSRSLVHFFAVAAQLHVQCESAKFHIFVKDLNRI